MVMGDPAEVKRVFVAFRYSEALRDTVKLVRKELEHSRASGVRWQVQVLEQMLAPSTVLFHGVLQAIRDADYVVVFSDDMSMNVAFEAGMAFALGKPTAFCVPEGEIRELFQKLSDISGIVVATYNRNRLSEVPKVVGKALLNLHKQASEKAKESPKLDYLLAWAENLRFNGLHREAVDKYLACLSVDPTSVRCHVGLGQSYLALYDLVRAEKALRTALGIQADCVPAWEVLGQVLLDSGRYEEAVGVYQRLLRSNTDRTEYYFKLAVAFCEMQQPERGVDVLEAAVREHPEVASVHYDLAWCAARAARSAEQEKADRLVARALEALTRAVAIDEAYYTRAAQDKDFDGFRDLDGFPTRR
jgi:tetratricopeptide (TPR) repeat protein